MIPMIGVSWRRASTAAGSALASAGSGTMGASVPSKSSAITAPPGSSSKAPRPARPSAVAGTGSRLAALGFGVVTIVAYPRSSAFAARTQLVSLRSPSAQPGHERGVEPSRLSSVDQLVEQLVVPGRGQPECLEYFAFLGTR